MTPRQLAFLGLAVLLLIPVLYLVLRSDEKITNYPPKNQKVIAFGDSLTEGVGSTAGNDLVSAIGQRLGVEIVNNGKSGDTTETALGRIQEILPEEPGIVILLLGGNDIIRRISKKETFENLSTIIERFQNAGAVVVLLGVRGGILGDGYEGDYHNLAKKYHTAYVSNVLDGLIGNTKYMYDSVHPNDAGYSVIANRVASTLKEVMRQQ